MFRKQMKYILILIIIVLIFIILEFNKTRKNIFDDILIFGIWQNIGVENEYEIGVQDSIQIDVFKTIYNKNKKHNKIAPGSHGKFTIKIKKVPNLSFEITIDEKTSKPQNLIFLLDGQIYYSIKDAESVINEKLQITDCVIINWEWRYDVSPNDDIQDTKDGENALKYIFEIGAIIQDEKNEYEI